MRAATRAAVCRAVRWVVFFTVPLMLDDNKRPHAVKLWLTDREYVDLCKQADREDRKAGEMGRVIVRRYMYGNVAASEQDVHRANRADEGRE